MRFFLLPLFFAFSLVFLNSCNFLSLDNDKSAKKFTVGKTGFLISYGNIFQYRLKNGLVLFVIEDTKNPLVYQKLWYKVGSSYERPGVTGVSHMLEHMLFKGSKNYPAGEFSKAVTNWGGIDNAGTSKDYTVYYQTVKRQHLESIMQMEADRMKNSILVSGDLKKEKLVVKEERKIRVDSNPESLAQEDFKSLAFATSSYRYPTIGRMEDINKYNLKKIKKWYEDFYAPNNAVLVIAGDVKADLVYELAKKYYGVVKASKTENLFSMDELEHQGMKINYTESGIVKSPSLRMGYVVPSLASLNKTDKWKAYALEIISYIIDAGNTGLLTKNLVNDKQIAMNTWVSYSPLARMKTLLSLGGTLVTSKISIEDLKNEFVKQINTLKDKPVNNKKLDEIKYQIEANSVYSKESLEYIIYLLGASTSFGIDWLEIMEYDNNIRAITPKQIQQAAKEFFVEKNLSINYLVTTN